MDPADRAKGGQRPIAAGGLRLEDHNCRQPSSCAQPRRGELTPIKPKESFARAQAKQKYARDVDPAIGYNTPCRRQTEDTRTVALVTGHERPSRRHVDATRAYEIIDYRTQPGSTPDLRRRTNTDAGEEQCGSLTHGTTLEESEERARVETMLVTAVNTKAKTARKR
jgi:hypothetical protein